MNIREFRTVIEENISNLEFINSYNDGGTYSSHNLNKLRIAINNTSKIPLVQDELSSLKNTQLFADELDTKIFSIPDTIEIEKLVSSLKTGLEYLLRYIKSNDADIPDDSIIIKIAEVNGFDALAKISTDLKKVIDIPVNDQGEGGNVNIISAEKGSILLTVSLGSIPALELVTSIYWSVAVLKAKEEKANIANAHVAELDMSEEVKAIIKKANDDKIDKDISDEASAIVAKHIGKDNPETLERIKLAITTLQGLVDKGVKLLPVSSKKEITELFPDMTKLHLIESKIKQINAPGA